MGFMGPFILCKVFPEKQVVNDCALTRACSPRSGLRKEMLGLVPNSSSITLALGAGPLPALSAED